MDLSPTDLKLVAFDLYKTDEKYDFKLTNILRRRHRPIMFIMDKFGDPLYSSKPEVGPPDDRFGETITPDLITKALQEARRLLKADTEPMGNLVRQVIINKPGEKCALIVLDKKFWCMRIFELEGGLIDDNERYAALVEPIGDPQASNLDMHKIKGLFRLSKREADVVEKLVLGSTDKDIANQLGISVETVRAYLKSVRAKLGVSTRTAIASVIHNLREDSPPPS